MNRYGLVFISSQPLLSRMGQNFCLSLSLRDRLRKRGRRILGQSRLRISLRLNFWALSRSGVGWAGGGGAAKWRRTGESSRDKQLVATIWETRIPGTAEQGQGQGRGGTIATWSCLHPVNLLQVANGFHSCRHSSPHIYMYFSAHVTSSLSSNT